LFPETVNMADTTPERKQGEAPELKKLSQWQIVMTDKPHNECFQYLDKVSLKSISSMTTAEKDQVTVQTSDTFATVIDAFRHFHIHSVPVIRTQTHKMGGQVAGFIDMLDIATTIARSFPADRSLTEDEADKLSDSTQQLGNTPAWGLINASHKDLHFSFHQDHHVTNALDIFTKGIHRVTIFDDSKHLIGICSQMDVIKRLHDEFKKGKMAEFGKQSLKSFGYGMGSGMMAAVISIPPTATVLEAAHKMANTGAKALAIVGPDGSLRGNFSATDLINAINASDPDNDEGGPTEGLNDLRVVINLFLTPVERFLKKYSPTSLEPCMQLPSSSFADCVRLLATQSIHQLWVVKNIEAGQRNPVGVVTLTDVCRIIAGLHWPETSRGYMPAGVNQPKRNVPSSSA
jgi:CBS domain-containing protein